MTFPRRKCPRCRSWLELHYLYGQAYEACSFCGWAPRIRYSDSTAGLEIERTADNKTVRSDVFERLWCTSVE